MTTTEERLDAAERIEKQESAAGARGGLRRALARAAERIEQQESAAVGVLQSIRVRAMNEIREAGQSWTGVLRTEEQIATLRAQIAAAEVLLPVAKQRLTEARAERAALEAALLREQQ